MKVSRIALELHNIMCRCINCSLHYWRDQSSTTHWPSLGVFSAELPTQLHRPLRCCEPNTEIVLLSIPSPA